MQQISFSQNIKGDNMLRFLARNKRIFEFFSTRFYTEIYIYIIKQKTRIFPSVCLSTFPIFRCFSKIVIVAVKVIIVIGFNNCKKWNWKKMFEKYIILHCSFKFCFHRSLGWVLNSQVNQLIQQELNPTILIVFLYFPITQVFQRWQTKQYWFLEALLQTKRIKKL